MKSLYEQLKTYAQGEAYPFHMPGHKRNMDHCGFADPFSFDITEIDGFDNLHHACGILKDAQERAARLYGAKESFFLVNGSTAGILSAVSACVSQRGTLVMARNCHKAVYHTAFLKELETVYLYPEQEPVYGLNGGIAPENVRDCLERHPEAEAVIITSPTYDGMVSDIRGIAQIVHSYGLPLIVDEAHGAHLRFHPDFPESAVDQGADVVIQSVHKTLPALTQTALLHVCGDYVDAQRIRKYLGIYQTSSPSYVLMASIDYCVQMLEDTERTRERFDLFVKRLHAFREETKTLRYLRVPGEELTGTAAIAGMDPSKLVISGKAAGLDGQEMAAFFREDAGLEMEMAAGSYVLALTTIMDTEEGFQRLLKAVRMLDEQIQETAKKMPNSADYEDTARVGELLCPEVVLPIYEAENARKERVPLGESEGRISAEYIYLYPPGIPLVTPGERITGKLLSRLNGYRDRKFALEGMEDTSAQMIQVVKAD